MLISGFYCPKDAPHTSPVKFNVVFDNICDGLCVSSRARATAVNVVCDFCQLVSHTVGNVDSGSEYSSTWHEFYNNCNNLLFFVFTNIKTSGRLKLLAKLIWNLKKIIIIIGNNRYENFILKKQTSTNRLSLFH